MPILHQRKFHRRKFLQSLAITGALCPICSALGAKFAAAQTTHAGPHWTYEGEGGPEHWGELSPDFKVCELGFEQTPIDLTRAVSAQLTGVIPQFQPMPLKILNNGHTVQVNCQPGSRSLIDGKSFELLQFHFHHPSEHLLSGQSFDLELHFVHRSAEGQLAVLGVFIRAGAENAALVPVWAAMPKEAAEEADAGTTIALDGLLPVGRGFFRYQGSLTTPPCSEGVLWTVFKDPIEASTAQIGQFAALFPNNARPVQSLHRRFLLDSL
ncbi:carbonic anhydrase [Dongia sp.]|uniref:carbonic anhydrase n=1 Tax=Dongia sp. TaxID=1977262 RepID=UPI0035B3314E